MSWWYILSICPLFLQVWTFCTILNKFDSFFWSTAISIFSARFCSWISIRNNHRFPPYSSPFLSKLLISYHSLVNQTSDCLLQHELSLLDFRNTILWTRLLFPLPFQLINRYLFRLTSVYVLNTGEHFLHLLP